MCYSNVIGTSVGNIFCSRDPEINSLSSIYLYKDEESRIHAMASLIEVNLDDMPFYYINFLKFILNTIVSVSNKTINSKSSSFYKRPLTPGTISLTAHRVLGDTIPAFREFNVIENYTHTNFSVISPDNIHDFYKIEELQQ